MANMADTSIENDHYLAMRKSHLQQLVVDVFAIGGENRTSADQSPQDGKHGFQNRQSERDHRNGHRHERRRFLRPARASALSMNPINRLPESPEKLWRD